ncbi:MAG: hypothetical protein OXD31_17270 [Chloroflexi bacterium]|nr:hypothetical protein [Chloroflexota bacterium]
MRISPIVILDCRWRGSYLYDCRKFALYGLSNPGWYRTEYYCGEHLREAVMDDFNEGISRFIIIPLYTVEVVEDAA